MTIKELLDVLHCAVAEGTDENAEIVRFAGRNARSAAVVPCGETTVEIVVNYSPERASRTNIRKIG